MRKNGETRDGKKLRRGNNTGSLYRKKDKAGKFIGPWYMVFSERTPEGKLVRRLESTQTNDKDTAAAILKTEAAKRGYDGRKEAERIDNLLAVKRNLENEQARLEREREEREKQKREAQEREKQKREEQDRDNNAITFRDAFIHYADSTKRPDSGARTLADYEQKYNTFVSWLNTHLPDVKRIRDFTPEMAESFIRHLTDTRSRSTRNKYLIFLRGFWRVMRWNPNAQITIDPWEGIRNLTTTPDEVVRKELTIAELTRISETISSGVLVEGYKIKDVFSFDGENIREELRVLFAVGIYTGLRLGDCATIQWGNIDLLRRVITVTPRKTARKYKRIVIIPIHPALWQILNAYKPQLERNGQLLPVLCDIYENREPSLLTNRIQAILRAAGIQTTTKPKSGTKTRTLAGFHSLRHTFTSIMLNARIDSMLVEKMLGHSSDSMTARYFHEHAAALAMAIASLPVLPQLLAAHGEPVASSSIEAKTAAGERLNTIQAIIEQMDIAELAATADLIKGEQKRRQQHAVQTAAAIAAERTPRTATTPHGAAAIVATDAN